MYYIKEAKFRRMAEYNGVPCAEIQVSPGRVDDPDLFVYIARDHSGKGYEIVRMIRSDADLEIDWFNNDMHDAFAEVSEENFGDCGWPEPAEQRKQFMENLLAGKDIITKLEQYLLH
ncbi:hypothetical protein [Paenibacillus segetis]|uniref:Large polyvalent protein associated domain-containing protein n=1 Tax=Paenibacillus segetis TaxID=1325360 RepID=A0ABQ1YPG3_9BACL|nr:hypothetical protein [Paenibacillus segetis]GGH33743.1 hypothetical protein GCM10008013_39070 [Paenibacillus segetis]